MTALNGRTLESQRDQRGGDLSVRGKESESPGSTVRLCAVDPRANRTVLRVNRVKHREQLGNKLLSPELKKKNQVSFLRKSQERNSRKPFGYSTHV